MKTKDNFHKVLNSILFVVILIQIIYSARLVIQNDYLEKQNEITRKMIGNSENVQGNNNELEKDINLLDQKIDNLSKNYNELYQKFNNIECDLINKAIEEAYEEAIQKSSNLNYKGLSVDLFAGVLENKISFLDNETGERMYLCDLNEDDYEIIPDNFCILDMNGDQYAELIINMNIDMRIVFFQYQGEIYSYFSGCRGLGDIKVDGTFLFSSGAADSGIGQLLFENQKIEVNRLFQSISYADENMDYPVKYYIGNVEITEDDFNQLFKKQNAKDNVNWYEIPTIGNSVFNLEISDLY